MQKPLFRLAAAGWLALSVVLTTAAQRPAASGGTPETTLPLTDLSAFKNAGANWKIVGDVNADLSKAEVLNTTPGTGVLVNQPTSEAKTNLLSAMEHGDLDIAFDYMIATHSNSGFYLQGRYEVQLLDSWGVKTPAYGDNGGIYKRRELPSGRLYEGHAPRTNASKAPGLWQRMEISFQAPRFDASGKKTANAKMLRIALNGVVLHENVELTGPTGGPISEQEAPTGPFMIQGDHGAVAFRNFIYRSYAGKAPTVGRISYKTYAADDNETFAKIPDFSGMKTVATGTTDDLTYDVVDRDNNFGVLLNGTLNVPAPGKYTFRTDYGGLMRMTLNGKPLFIEQGPRMASAELPAGNVPFEIAYVKREEWVRPALGLFVEGPGFRQTALHSVGSMLASPPTDPILLDAGKPTILRSFVDYFKDGKRLKRIVHAVNVGTPEGLHFTFDLDNGALAQGWRGDFLDTTPMWHDRGDGSSRPRGMVAVFNDLPSFAVLADANAAWPESMVAENPAFRPLGYDLDASQMPTFRYLAHGTEVEDAIRPADGGKALSRELSVKNPAANLYHLVATGKDIVQLQPGLYAVEGKSYYVKADGATLRTAGDQQQLVMPVKGGKIAYSLLF
mgnify:CR=1 FL=1